MYTYIKTYTPKFVKHPNRATLRIIPNLIANGIIVDINHSRYMFVNDGAPILIDMKHVAKADRQYLMARGGVTEVSLTFPDGLTFIGQAICSQEDNFSRSTGINIALSRALAKHKIQRESLKELAKFSVGDNGAGV